jgi:tetratricopeptide (TPR) repeat protein
MRRILILCVAALASWAPAHGAATDSARYEACMEAARAAPKEGLQTAEAWLAEVESTAGRHCRAVALIGLGREEEAVAALDALGRRIEEREPALAADLYRQAAMVRLQAGRLDAAEKLQDRGLKLAPDSVELLIDRALLLGARKKYEDALSVLERAHALAPARVDILVLSASAHRMLGQEELAKLSLVSALEIEPGDPAALLERGMLRRLDGDAEGARADWVRVRTIAPDSPEAETAARNLKLLEETEATDAEPE